MTGTATEVDLWWVGLDQIGSVRAALGELLTEAERARCARVRRPAVRDRLIVARGALRAILAHYVSEPAAALRFEFGEREKPALAGGGPHFNLSHSGAAALVAVSAGCPVGVDIEHPRPGLRAEAIARRYFTEAEVAYLSERTPPFDQLAALGLWTCKESCVKESGAGIEAIEAVEVLPREDGEWLAVGPGGPWQLARCTFADSYVGAVATRGERPLLARRRFDPRPV